MEKINKVDTPLGKLTRIKDIKDTRYHMRHERREEFLLWLRGLRTRLAPMRMQVQSLASVCGLRIQHCPELWCRSLVWLQLLFDPLAWEVPYERGFIAALPTDMIGIIKEYTNNSNHLDKNRPIP